MHHTVLVNSFVFKVGTLLSGLGYSTTTQQEVTMKTITAISAIAFLSLAVPAFADETGVVQKTAPGGMNNGVSPGDQRGLNKGVNGVTEGRSSANDANGNMVNDNNAPGGMNNGVSPAIQHTN